MARIMLKGVFFLFSERKARRLKDRKKKTVTDPVTMIDKIKRQSKREQ